MSWARSQTSCAGAPTEHGLKGVWHAGIHDEHKRRLLHKAAAYLERAPQSLDAARLQVLQAPKVLKRPHTVASPHGDQREDNYYWLRDDERTNPEVIEHLQVKTCLDNHCPPWLPRCCLRRLACGDRSDT